MHLSAYARAPRLARPFARLLLAAAAAALSVPATAQAHSGAGVIALDYRATIAPLGSGMAGVEASVQDGDRRIRLAVDPGRTVVVLGYGGEPFLRFAGAGVAVNNRSQTAVTTRLVSGSETLKLDPEARPSWRQLSSGHAFAWHDHRLAPPLPAGKKSTRWLIPVLVDGRRQQIWGEFRRFGRPPLWPWLLAGAAILGAAAAVALAWKSRERPAAVVFSVVAGAAALATVTGFALGGAHGRRTDYVEIGAACVLALAGIFSLLFARTSRAAVAGILGALAAGAGLGAIRVFQHSVVISALPTVATRAAAVVALCGGAAAVALSVHEAGHSR